MNVMLNISYELFNISYKYYAEYISFEIMLNLNISYEYYAEYFI